MNIKHILLTVTLFICSLVVSAQETQSNLNDQGMADEVPIVSILSIIGSLGAVSAIAYGMMQHMYHLTQKRRREEEEYLNSFNTIVANLTSTNSTIKLSAAILLRRYLRNTKKFADLKLETINVISSLSRVLPTSILQKTLVDGLASSKDLSNCDFAKTNLQDAYIGVKEGNITMNRTDLFLADLSYALLQNIVGHNIIFYRSVLLGAQIKDCDFTGGNFVGADLTNASFKNVILNGADFSDAYNIPKGIESKLVNGKYPDDKPVTAKHFSMGKSIFFSMPGKLEKGKEAITKEYKRILEGKGYDVIYYNRDLYPAYGQFNRVRESLNRSAGMVAFGLQQINIHSATYRPGTDEKEEWTDKWLSTPWSDIEVGMGLMKGIPILLVTDSEINSGVFDKGLTECYVANISTDCDFKTLDQNPQLEAWLSKL
ncbi:MAG: pentapeptide repeat-containing protein [Bacteroidales bacterium]|nr:pentapeptide repeat-containing protein [Bacteroidales bacterium]